jgi:hypothetical protein
MADQHHEVGVVDERRDRAHVGLDVDMRRHVVHRLAQHERRIERQDLELVRRPEPRSAMVGVVVHVDGGADVGPQPQDPRG